MPEITLTETTMGLLKNLAEPFVDTPETVVCALVKAELQRRSAESNGTTHCLPHLSKGVLRLNADHHDDLAHSRLLNASIDGEPVHKPNWNKALERVHILAFNRLGSFEALRQASTANLRMGCFEENGYKFLPEVNFSIQGVDSNLSWDHSLQLARQLRFAIEFTLEWRNKEEAAQPGKQAILRWAPPS